MIPETMWAAASGLANHLWQSTVFLIVAGALTLLFRRNSARIRYKLWRAASIKFLIPFSLLFGIGSYMEWPSAPRFHQAGMPAMIRYISEPFASSAVLISSVDSLPALPAGPSPVIYVLAAVWFCGAAAVLVSWWVNWRRVSAILSTAQPFEMNGNSGRLPQGTDRRVRVRLVSSPAGLEPGVFGILRPVVLLPVEASHSLLRAQLEAIIAHEMFHVRGRDNLAAAIHTIVQAVFWFHPLAWWLGRKLVDERERACDEAVLQSGYEPAEYAEGILKVCKSQLKPPVACMAGAAGSNLTKRIEAIMDYRGTNKLGVGRRLLLMVAGAGAVGGPLLFGMLNNAAQRSGPEGPPTPLLAMSAISTEVAARPAPQALARIVQQNQQRPIHRGDVVMFRYAQEGADAIPISQQPAEAPPALENWADAEVSLIITRAERVAFGALRNETERGRFVDQFWLLRDPTPGTPVNEFKDEYYRRIAYANERFAMPSGVPGWKTDRGLIYIIHGPPDSIESHPVNGAYRRPQSDGGGVFGRYAFEKWWYRRLEALGNGVDLEFVDVKGTGEYRLTFDPSDRNALLPNRDQ